MERKTIGQILEECKPKATYNWGRTSLSDLQDMSRDITQMEQDYRSEMLRRMIRMREIEERTMRQRDVEMSGHARGTGKSRFLTDWAADHMRDMRRHAAPTLAATTDTITIPAGSVLTYTLADGGQLQWTTTADTNEDGIAF